VRPYTAGLCGRNSRLLCLPLTTLKEPKGDLNLYAWPFDPSSVRVAGKDVLAVISEPRERDDGGVHGDPPSHGTIGKNGAKRTATEESMISAKSSRDAVRPNPKVWHQSSTSAGMKQVWQSKVIDVTCDSKTSAAEDR
jgi:hypothetical protein